VGAAKQLPLEEILPVRGGEKVDRVPYRRVTPPRNEKPSTAIQNQNNLEENEAAISRGEALIMQCIISAVIFVVVLAASFLDIAPAVTARDGIRQILSGAETLDELVQDVRQLGAEWFGWDAPAVPVEPEIIDYPAPVHELYEGWFHDIEQTTHTTPEDPDTDTGPIEEDRQADETSNHTVPEPPVTPGLWD